MFKKLKEYFSETSGTERYLIILTILFTVVSIVLNIACNMQAGIMEENVTQGVFSEENRNLFVLMGFGNLFEELKTSAIILFTMVINVLFGYLSYWMGKGFGFFKDLGAFFSDVQESKLCIILLLYDVIAMAFEMYALMSLLLLLIGK